MQLDNIRPRQKIKKRKRIGRGGKRGTYSGRGQKGQKARAGKKLKPVIRSFIKRYPKLRGYKFKKQATKPAILNIDKLDEKFKEGERVNPQSLMEKGLINRIKGKIPEVKILGRGKVNKALIIEGCHISEKAKKNIEKAGGRVGSNISQNVGVKKAKAPSFSGGKGAAKDKKENK